MRGGQRPHWPFRTSRELDNLVAARRLAAEPASEAEVATLLQRVAALLTDEGNAARAPASHFDLAQDAALATAALRVRGYRSEEVSPPMQN